MVGIVVITHCRLAEELLAAAELIVGKVPHCAAISIDPGEGITRIGQKVENAIAAVDQGQEASDWFRGFLGVPCRLVGMADEHVRPTGRRLRPGDQVSFADSYPLLLISEASLEDLNARLAAPLPMDRFRPNIVVSGCPPYAEDGWRTVRAGAVGLDVMKPCVRCVITTTDQQTAQRSTEPLRTLATYRRDADGGVIFGQNLLHHGPGALRVGDPVEVLETA